MELAGGIPTLGKNEVSQTKTAYPISESHQFPSTLPSYRNPIEVGHFCVDSNMLYQGNAYALRHYKPPISKNFKFHLKSHDTSEDISVNMDIKYWLHPILMWINAHRDVFNSINEDNETGDKDGEQACGREDNNESEKCGNTEVEIDDKDIFGNECCSISGWERLQLNLLYSIGETKDASHQSPYKSVKIVQEQPAPRCRVRYSDTRKGKRKKRKHVKKDISELLNDVDEHPGETSLHVNFIAWNGNLLRFLVLPYKREVPWVMGVTLFNGTIYLCEMEMEAARQQRLSNKPDQRGYNWGYNFEGFMTENTEEIGESTLHPTSNSKDRYYSVFQTKLDNNTLLFGAGIDCCIASDALEPPNNYIELKIIKKKNYLEKNGAFMHKSLMCWAQAFLIGIPKVVLGLWEDAGIVTSLKTYNTSELPLLFEKQTGDANVCLHFLSKFLNWLKKTVVLDNPKVVYMLSYDEPFDNINIEVIIDGSERFLPVWYTSGFVDVPVAIKKTKKNM